MTGAAVASRDWDAIVIGAGIGGLTTAAYLQTNGVRTLVLEQYDVAGGCTHVFRRRRSYEFDVGLHYVGDCGPDGQIPMILRGVGLEGRVDWLEMDPDGFDTLVFPGLEFRVPRGWDRYADRLAERFPGEERGIRRCVAVLERVGRQAIESRTPTGLASYATWPLTSPSLVRWGLRPLSKLFDACGLGPGPRAVMGGHSGLYGAPPSRAAVLIHAVILHHYIGGGAYYPRGGGHVPAALLVNAIQTHGGRVRTRARVDRILVRGGRVEGVRLADGEEITAPVVVSDADLKRTLLGLVPREHVPRRLVRRVRGYRMAPPIFSVYLGLDVDLRERVANTNFWCLPSLDPEVPYAPWQGRIPERLLSYVVSATLKDPHTRAIAPRGHSSVELMTFVPPDYAFWGVADGPAAGERYSRNPRYLAAKERVTERLIRDTARAVPALHDLEDRIAWREAATPITQERYTLTTGGSCYGLELSTDQVGPRRPLAKTPIDGLFLAGANQFYGHGVYGTMLGGMAAAGAVLGRDLRREVADGAVYGDPSRITAGGPEWDPFMATRRLSVKRRATPRQANFTPPTRGLRAAAVERPEGVGRLAP